MKKFGGHQGNREEQVNLARFFKKNVYEATGVSQERAINANSCTSDVNNLGTFAGHDRSIGAGLHVPAHCS
jgi:hypothetical protein